MKIFCSILPKEEINEKFQNLKDVEFSLFIETLPKSNEDLSPINVLVLVEPNGYFGHSNWAIENQNLFSIILTWDQRVLNNCPNAIFMPFGHSWFHKEQYEKNHDKVRQVSHLCGALLKTYGQSMRHEILSRESEIINMPKKFFHTYGDRHNIEEARIGKEEVFGDSQFGIAIENFSHKGYFSEKILDCFLLKTIPIYWGCSDLDEFFNRDGFIKFENVDDLIEGLNNIPENYYYLPNVQKAIEENYNTALKYVDYAQNLVDKITEVFTLNKLI